MNLEKTKETSLTKNHKDSLVNSRKIKPINGFNISVFNYMNSLTGEQNKNTPNMDDFLEKNHQNYKKLTLDNQLKMLFYYIKINSKDGLFKRPSLAKLGEYFGNVDKNTIKKRLDMLIDKGYMRIVTDLDIHEMKNTYKLLKEEY